MILPSVTRDNILEAMKVFDESQRHLPKWKHWQNNESFKYAIVHGEQLYPVKEIVSLATSRPVSSFNGGVEANDFVRARQFDVRRIALPTESEVLAALHDLLLERSPNPVQPQEAYETLASQFELSPNLKLKPMEKSPENHWQNRIRFARRKLVAAGVLDPSEHGVWRLLLRNHPLYWVEKTLVANREDRLHGDNKLGRALWSPMRARNGTDIYRNMRLVQPGDLILHLTDNDAFTGVSVADGFARTDFTGLPGTNWAGDRCYRIQLREFMTLQPPLTKTDITATENLRRRLQDIRAANQNLFYDPDLELHQGGYLTGAPKPLMAFLDEVYSNNTGQHLFNPGARIEPLHREIPREPADGQRTKDPEHPNPAYTIEDFAAETALPEEVLKQWRDRLLRKKHMIFQGPPGTGKTFLAGCMARLLMERTVGFTETVQFHPSYSYEDFMQGIRPVVVDKQMIFERIPGQFMQFCRRAQRAPDKAPCILIIDEINRGNLSRIFGELMYLLEYRDKQIPLAGDERPFGIPDNVIIIGTMNTADRSIALVDHALRRRFSFVHIGPDYDVLRIHLERTGLKPESLIKALKLVNAAIDDRNYEVGISFFLKDGAKLRDALRDIWEGEIEPYLEEYFYDQPGKLVPLRWKNIGVDLSTSF